MTVGNKPVIAITGSAGKSTTKEMIAAILATRWKVFKSVGNLNFYTHTQKYAKQFRSGKYRAAVLEYGMSQKGHIRKHCSYLRPDVSVVTNIGTAHLGSFGGDVKKLIQAKSELIRYMRRDGMAVYNADDANCRAMPHGNFTGTLVTIGVKEKADYAGKDIQYAAGGMKFSVILDGQSQSFFIPIYGRHEVYNALCAVAVADKLGFTSAEIRRGLKHFRRMNHRLVVHRLNRRTLLIDDSFSANPNAVKAAVDVLQNLGAQRKVKTLAVLGPMMALGMYTVKGHRDVGQYVAKKKVDWLYTYGKSARHIGQAAVDSGFASSNWRHFTTRLSLHKSLARQLSANRVILVKGSHGSQMNDTVSYLLRMGKQGREKLKNKA